MNVNRHTLNVEDRTRGTSDDGLVTEVRIGKMSRWGVTADLWPTGFTLEIDPGTPIDKNQPLQVIISTDISWLDLHAVVTNVETEPSDASFGITIPAIQHLTVAFQEEDAIRASVLESLIDAYHEGTLPVTLVVIVDRQEETSETRHELLATTSSGHRLGDSAEGTCLQASVPAQRAGLATCPKATSSLEAIHVESVRLDFQSRPGHRLAGYQDGIPHLSSDAPVAILAPGYGHTARTYIPLAYQLAAAGFRVLRYDHRNHVGDSTGAMRNACLSSMKADMEAIVDYAARRWPSSPRVVVATSLAGRVALKAAPTNPNIQLLVLVTPILDFHATLSTVHHEDLFVACLRNSLGGSTNILGYAIDGTKFLDDAIKGGYADLASSLRDGRSLTIPTIILAAERDPWVSLDDVRHLVTTIPHEAKKLLTIPDAVHHLHEDRTKADAMYRELVETLHDLFPTRLPNTGGIPSPSWRSLERQVRRERFQSYHPSHPPGCETHHHLFIECSDVVGANIAASKPQRRKDSSGDR